MVIKLQIPDELAANLQTHENELPKILELGLRELNAEKIPGFEGLAQVLERLADLPAPEEVLALQPSPPLQKRISELLEKNRSTGLSESEEREWEKYEFLEHLVRLAKAKALIKLKAA